VLTQINANFELTKRKILSRIFLMRETPISNFLKLSLTRFPRTDFYRIDKMFYELFSMVPQTETRAGAGFKAGVKDYRLTYYTPDYVVKDTDILAAFRMTPQPGVPAEECGAAVAAESSTGTWTTVWTDGLTTLDRYKGRCYDIEPVPGEDNVRIG